jgi:hypothetical protein
MNKMIKWQSYWLPFILAICIGSAIGYIDSGKNWDDTGITVLAVFISSLLLGLFKPRGAWLWALEIGSCVVLFNFFRNGNLQSALAIVVSLIGSYTGVMIRKFR